MDLSDTSKIVGPSPLRSQVIRNHDRQKECFLTNFWEKMVCFTKLTPRTPPSVIHGWKATDLLSQMVKRKNYLLNPISRQNFADAFAVNHNLKLEVCRMKVARFESLWGHSVDSDCYVVTDLPRDKVIYDELREDVMI